MKNRCAFACEQDDLLVFLIKEKKQIDSVDEVLGVHRDSSDEIINSYFSNERKHAYYLRRD